MSEIEDYRRIQVASGSAGDSVEVVGSASLDVAHLFAELLENAVRFSPPDTSVEVLVRRRGELCLVYVSDTGMGMTDEQLEEANELLANPPEPGLDLSRTLGLYVAGRLAARHGVTVRLARSAYDGIVASVSLPRELISDLSAPEPVSVAASAVVEDVAASRLAETHGRRLGDASGAVVPTYAPAPADDEIAAPGALPQRVQALPERPIAEPSNGQAPAERVLGAAPSRRSPDERRQQLSSFLRRLDEGRGPAEPDSDVAEEQVS